MANTIIGLDLSKDKIDACKLPTQVFQQFDNTPQGHKKLIRWIGIDIKCVIFEPTGSYHRQLEQALIGSIARNQNQPQTGTLFCQSLW